MTSQTHIKTRRTFLKAGILIGGAALVGTGIKFAWNPDAETIARLLTSHLAYPDLAIELGETIIKDDPRLANLTLDQMTDIVLKDAGFDREKVSYFSLLRNFDAYRRTVHEDFAIENILHVNGWVLSATEAHLCALLYLYKSNNA
jgi:hypothetical protein